jgi:hypothetical protein
MSKTSLSKSVIVSRRVRRMQLEGGCSEALRSYIELVKEGCSLLGEVKEFPVPEHTRNEIFSHRRRELMAHSEYTKARRRLWDFLTTSKLNEADEDAIGQGG